VRNVRLNVPFPLPEETLNPARGREIVREVAARVAEAAEQARQPLVDRQDVVRNVQEKANHLIYDYFDVDEVEKCLIDDAIAVIIPSTRPSRASDDIPTLKTSTLTRREEYRHLLCQTLNGWAQDGPYRVDGRIETSAKSGVGIVVLERRKATATPAEGRDHDTGQLIPLLAYLQKEFKRELGSVEMVRGLKVFDRNTLYVIKPLAQRFWTKTAALNDADDIAGTILLQHAQEKQ
jgi:hypothetical protein